MNIVLSMPTKITQEILYLIMGQIIAGNFYKNSKMFSFLF